MEVDKDQPSLMSPGQSPRQGSILDKIVRLALINDLECDGDFLTKLLLDPCEVSHLEKAQKWTVPVTSVSQYVNKREKMEKEIKTLEDVKDHTRNRADNDRCSEHILLTVLKRNQINAQILKGVVSKKIEEIRGLKGVVDKQFEEIELLKGVEFKKCEEIKESLERRDREQDKEHHLESWENLKREVTLQVEKLEQSERESLLKIGRLENEGHALQSDIEEMNKTIKALQWEAEESTILLVEKSQVVDSLEIRMVEQVKKVSELEAVIESNLKRSEKDRLQLNEAVQKLQEDQLHLNEDRGRLKEDEKRLKEDRLVFNEGAQRLGRNESTFEAVSAMFAETMASGMKTWKITMATGNSIYEQYLKDKAQPYQTFDVSTSLAADVKNEQLNLPVKMEIDMEFQHSR